MRFEMLNIVHYIGQVRNLDVIVPLTSARTFQKLALHIQVSTEVGVIS